MQVLYDHRPASIEDLDDITDIADFWFDSDAFVNGIAGRRDYFEMLVEANQHTFWVLEYYDPDESDEVVSIAGYTSVIAERPDAILRHRRGILNVYYISPNDIFRADEAIAGENFTFYLQAVVMHPSHRKIEKAKKERNIMLAHHLANVMTNYEGLNYCLLAEQFSPGGKVFMDDRGFQELNMLSGTKHLLHCFDSTAPNLPDEGQQLIEQVKRFRNK
jgi:hypothetical protein